MFDRQNPHVIPDLICIAEYVRNPLWMDFCNYVMNTYQVKPTFDFSKCSWEYGWNVKFKKGSQTICTLYPKENYFTVMIVIGLKEKERFEKLYSQLCPIIQRIVDETKEGNGQKWLMIDCEDDDQRMHDVKQILEVRGVKHGRNKKAEY